MGEDEPEYLTSREVARLFRVDTATVANWARRWAETGEVFVVRTPGGQGNWRFLAADIRALAGKRRD